MADKRNNPMNANVSAGIVKNPTIIKPVKVAAVGGPKRPPATKRG